ncbi:unnamed protein product [Fraxinus pennsylvanica]|uniref:1-phosphatidylinositol 4-kinase n=1 Tax=Fraxinus pennsylvanica TaxID=56036 RepID=A0AAD1ZGU7_9LAMI|nr:unnamed protein product [Fraxinus pennsylvanica]
MCNNCGAVIHLLVRKSAKVRTQPLEKDFEISIVLSDVEKVADAVDDLDSWWGMQNETLQIVPAKSSTVGGSVSKISLSPMIEQLIDASNDGLKRDKQPIRASEGCGGAYFMPDSSGQDYISVFKPIDEEPMAVNNPRGQPLSTNGEGLKKGTRVGEGALREVAAYILDHPKEGPRSFHSDEKGFAGVPPTVMFKCRHRGFNYPDGYQYASDKIGSLQMFVKNSGSCEDGSLQMFVKNSGRCEDRGPRCAFPVEEVHKISVLDIRLANADRHAGNILVRKEGEEGRIVLIPIDHGYCLPENFEDCTFDWLYWPQTQQPFSPDTIAYIKSLDTEKDIQLLKLYGWNIPHKCARVFRLSTMLLKKGAERGLTPFAIGSIMSRETPRKESVIEKIVQEAVLPGTSESGFLEYASLIMDRYLDEFTP